MSGKHRGGPARNPRARWKPPSLPKSSRETWIPQLRSPHCFSPPSPSPKNLLFLPVPSLSFSFLFLPFCPRKERGELGTPIRFVYFGCTPFLLRVESLILFFSFWLFFFPLSLSLSLSYGEIKKRDNEYSQVIEIKTYKKQYSRFEHTSRS